MGMGNEYTLYETWEDVEVAIVDECRVGGAIGLRAVVVWLDAGYFARWEIDVDGGWESLVVGW
jgi:hypothetical protein